MAKAAVKEKATRVKSEELDAQILKFMRRGKEYTSREVVEGLGREPGNKEGQPVVKRLHALVEAKKIKQVPNEKNGYSWKLA
jgi:predicted HTH transcriptional regulator